MKSKKSKHEFRYGFPVGDKIDVNIVIEEFEKIRSRNKGILKPENVLESAKSKSSPLHVCFTWDDSKAALFYRLREARDLISAVKVTIEDVRFPVRQYVSVNIEDEGNSYLPIDIAMKDENYRRQILNDAIREMRTFECKFGNLKELADIFQAFKKVRDKLGD